MADNINITEGIGKTLRSKEVGGIHYPTYRVEPDTSGQCETYRNIDMSTTGASIKASAGCVYGGDFFNNHATLARYVKLYDKASAASSSDTPLRTYRIPPNGGMTFSKAVGITFTLGISIRACTGVADNDNTAPSANDVIVNLDWK